jgi:ArsR family transcriptional regulator, arsenate/arsenite/antimonite-responsive transcriptional repressor
MHVQCQMRRTKGAFEFPCFSKGEAARLPEIRGATVSSLRHGRRPPSASLTVLPPATIFAYANMKTKAVDRIDVMFRAFSDRTRLRILSMLRDGELCVCHIVNVLGVPQPKASRHLAYLRRAGLVTTRKQGLWSYYSLAPARSEFHEKLLACLGCCFRDVPELAKDAKRVAVHRSCCR